MRAKKIVSNENNYNFNLLIESFADKSIMQTFPVVITYWTSSQIIGADKYLQRF